MWRNKAIINNINRKAAAIMAIMAVAYHAAKSNGMAWQWHESSGSEKRKCVSKAASMAAA
jgi:hypothetical protein